MSYRSIFTGLAVVAAAALPADDVPFVWNDWFNEDYSGINAATWADTAGTWTRSAQDGSSIEELNGERYLQVSAAPGDLRFSTPASSFLRFWVQLMPLRALAERSARSLPSSSSGRSF